MPTKKILQSEDGQTGTTGVAVVRKRKTRAEEAGQQAAETKTPVKRTRKTAAAEAGAEKTAAKKTAAKKTAASKTGAEKTAARRTAAAASAASGAKKTRAAKKEEQPALRIIDPDLVELHTIAQAMLDKKAQQVCSLDFRSLGNGICDHFVICNADSTTAVLAIADYVEEQMLVQHRRKVMRKQGRENAFWIILDFSNIVVHVFQTPYREFYRLEDLWADSVKTTYGE